MLAYAANSPRIAGRAGSPKALTLIIAGHAALLTAVLMVKPELVGLPPTKPPIVINIPNDPPPPPGTKPIEAAKAIPQDSFIKQTTPVVDMDQTIPIVPFDQGPTIADIGAVIGTGPTTIPVDPPTAPVKRAAVFRTADSAVKPPYPLDKRRLGEEATIKLRLTIDTHGRVTAVEPVGAADASFLEAARRHILRAWRYQPATEDGVAIPSSTVINLSFRLEDV